MRIALAADHAGFELKQQMAAYLTRQGHDVVDLGTHSTAPVDYPDSDTYTAHQAVEHDDMNVLCIGARVIGSALACEIVNAFLNAQFSGEDRHQRRLNKIFAIERRFVVRS